MKVVVYGAGAVGSVLGGMLSLKRQDVLLVGRPPLADAVASDGLRLKSATGEYVAHPLVTDTLPPEAASGDACILLTVKAGAVPAAVDALAKRVPPETPIVCLQNGVAAEGTAAKRFARVYGGVVRMTCSMVQPGHASFRSLGRVIVGLYPKGADPLARALADAFTEAGFDAAASRSIESDKWLKVAVNVQSAFHAVIDTRDHDANEFNELNVAILEETARVFKAAKIRARSGDGKDPTIDEMIKELKRPRARRLEHGVKVHNSLWQDLYLRRASIESEFIHGPVINLGVAHAVAVPCNRAALEAALACQQAGGGPEKLRLTEVLDMVAHHRDAK